jgi:signal transduction histidine kinase
MDEQKQIELIRRIASVVGHELRNPLAVINNSAYFLKTKLGQSGSLDAKVEKHLGIVVSEIQRTDKMIADILTYSRPMQVTPGTVALGAIVQAQLAAMAMPSTIKVEKKVKEVEAKGDEKLLGDAVRRFLDNAVEAMAEGGSMTITVGKEKEMAFVEVKDSGSGIKPEVLAELFEPFRTGKPRGLGLGLALARKIALAHSGKVEGENMKGGGARFRLLVPAA